MPSAPPGFRSSPSGITSSPSGFTSSPSSPGVLGDPAKRRANDVVQWLHGVRRALEPFRQYSRAHPMAVEAQQRCVAGLLALSSKAELQLDVGPSALHLDGQAIPFTVQGAASKTRDPLATTLFNEGVRRLSFLTTLNETEASALLGEWIEAANAPLGGNVASRVWELEPRGLKLVLLDTFDGAQEGGDGTGVSAARTGSSRALSVGEQIDALVSAISSEGLAADGGGGFVSQGLIQVSADDVALLRSEALRNITAAQLASHEGAQTKTAGLDAATTQALHDELEAERQHAMKGLGASLLNAAVLNGEEDWPRILKAFAALVKSALALGDYALPLHTWQRLVAETRNDPIFGARRIEVLKQWKATLVSPEVMDALMLGLESETGREPTLDALKLMGKAAVPAVLKYASASRNEVARKAALGFVRDVDPALAASSAAAVGDTSNLGSLVVRIPTMPDAEARDILERLLSSHDVTTRRIGAKALTAKRAPLLRHQLVLARLQDNDAEVRVSMLKVVLSLEDPSTLPTLLSLAKRPRIDSPELEVLFEAISVIGSREAMDFLVNELHQSVGVRRIAAALALGAANVPAAREALTATAAKLLTVPALKTACRTALERLSKRGVT
ncbi:MAG: hypothetical protein Q8L14_14400 [Myxococcales bacterium]|nr:hypothetical protein [Myxococcales bacterium]